MIRVDSWGIAGSVRDAGRIGLAHLGRGRGGAVDLASLELANRLVGNAPSAGAFETSGGLRLEVVDRPLMVAIAGAPATVEVHGGPAVAWGVPTVLSPGASLHVVRLHGGMRAYVAVRGGVRPAPGSGAPGGVPVGPDPGTPASAVNAVPRERPVSVRVWPGPRHDWFTPEAWATLCSAAYTAGVGDRIGVRLDGPSLERAHHGELASEGLVEGAVQVPPDGRPIVMLADHPATGGYPVIAVVDPADLGVVAQSPPGTPVRFRVAAGALR